nr:hypothetical protein [Tanacetum cinerariifolium]
DSAEIGSPGVIVYGYDGLLMQPIAPPSLDYMLGPEHPPSPDYVLGPKHPPSPVEIPYLPEPEYPEYLAPSDNEAPLEDQPLPVDASPIAASPGYVADFDLEEDLEDDHADYPADGGDGDDDPFDDDDDDVTDDEDEDPIEDEEDNEEEEEHLASADSSAVPIVDHVLLAGDTEALETVRPKPSMSASMEACIARHVALLSPPLPVLSPPLPLPSPLTTSPTDTRASLGYRAVGFRMRALLSSTSRMTDIPEADVGESSAAGAARQPGPTESDLRRYRVEDRPDHRRTAMLLDREAMYASEAWAGSKDRSSSIAAHVRILEAHVVALIAQTSSLQIRLTTTLGRIEILKARDPEPQEGPVEAGSSWLSCMVIDVVMYGC